MEPVLAFAQTAITLLSDAVSRITEQEINHWFRPYAAYLTAMVSGLFGASFFMLLQLQSTFVAGTYHSIRTFWSWPVIWLRCAVGISGAIILFFFYETEFLLDELWPKLDEIGFYPVDNTENMHVPNKELSMLVIWSFLAGYSQRLVQTVLDNAEGMYGANNAPQ